MLLGAVECSTEEEIRVIEQLGFWRGGQKTTEYGDGFFSLSCVDQAFRLVQRGMARWLRGPCFCVDGRIELEPSNRAEHAPGKCKRIAPAY